MDAKLHALVLQLLQQTADGLMAAIQAPIGEIETGGETAERFQLRMELSIKRIGSIKDIMQGVSSPDHRVSLPSTVVRELAGLWEDQEDEQEYQRRQQKTTGEWEIS